MKHIARTIRDQCRQTDIVVRFGGEEFVVLTVNLDEASTRAFFEKIRMAIEESSIEHGITQIKVTASFGVCTALCDSLDDMLKSADDYLYRAKLNGRNRVEIGPVEQKVLTLS